ncbi:sigma factor-like helix-turn-helix DNA-binding protein [Actinokineospora sp. 24-640]
MRKSRLSRSGRAAIPGPRSHPADETRPDVRAAIAVLPDAQRLILRLRLIDGLSAEEVAAEVGMSPSGVRLAQHHALNALRAHLAEKRP